MHALYYGLEDELALRCLSFLLGIFIDDNEDLHLFFSTHLNRIWLGVRFLLDVFIYLAVFRIFE